MEKPIEIDVEKYVPQYCQKHKDDIGRINEFRCEKCAAYICKSCSNECLNEKHKFSKVNIMSEQITYKYQEERRIIQERLKEFSKAVNDGKNLYSNLISDMRSMSEDVRKVEGKIHKSIEKVEEEARSMDHEYKFLYEEQIRDIKKDIRNHSKKLGEQVHHLVNIIDLEPGNNVQF